MTQTLEHPPQARRKRRGWETAADMIRSMAVIVVMVIPLWFFGQSPNDEQRIREVDQSAPVRAWTSQVPAALVPGELPESWQPTVAQYEQEPASLRLGWVLGPESYVEFATTTASSQRWREEITGAASAEGSVDVDGVTWQRYQDDDGSVSLLRDDGGATVVVGTLRSTASEADLLLLARSVRSAG